MIAALTTLVLGAALDDVTVSARMADGALEVGAPHAFTVDVLLPEGTSAGDSGLPSPFLQLDVPDGVVLTEPPTDEEFISVPYERLLEGSSVEIPFRLEEPVADDATIGLVVTAYLSDEDQRRFLRRRLELPVRAGAEAREGDAADSSWGEDDGLLAIGDTAPSFALPLADGVEPFDLGAVLGKRPIFLTTYRAHW